MKVEPLLTIGMAHFNDYHGAYFTIQSLRLHHAEVMDLCEIVVVDNNPKSPHGEMLKTFIEGKVTNGRYIAYEDSVGTSCTKNRVFEEARGKYVVCLDCHVLVASGAIKKLIDYYKANPESNDLLSGPMVYDDMGEHSYATHFTDVWGSEMRGQWAKDERGQDPDGEPFEIDAMGCGLMSCRREAWLGFNEHFRGFGGEEWYIHDKFRNAGFKCLCLPFLRWPHRFGNPDPRHWPLQLFDKLRNHLIGHYENSTPLDALEEHFVESGKINTEEWNRLVTDPIGVTQPIRSRIEKKKGCCGGNSDNGVTTVTSLEELYELACNNPSDINEHAPKLRELAEQCDHVTEFGMRHGVSSVALLAGQPKRFITYDINDDAISGHLKRLQGETDFDFLQGNSLAVEIEPTDLLFIDTIHTADQLYAELERHASKVRKWIVLHDTTVFGETGENGGPGLLPALRRFMGENSQWSVIYDSMENNGLTVISCDDNDKPKLPGIVRMGINFSKALANHVATGSKQASAEVFKQRLEICSMCEHRNKDNCSRCGCPVATRASWAEMPCPIGKWPEEKE